MCERTVPTATVIICMICNRSGCNACINFCSEDGCATTSCDNCGWLNKKGDHPLCGEHYHDFKEPEETPTEPVKQHTEKEETRQKCGSDWCTEILEHNSIKCSGCGAAFCGGCIYKCERPRCNNFTCHQCALVCNVCRFPKGLCCKTCYCVQPEHYGGTAILQLLYE